MKKNACESTAHHFEKFDESSIFCTACGESRVIDVAALIEQLRQLPIVMPCPFPHWQPYQPIIWTNPWPNTITIWNGTSCSPTNVVEYDPTLPATLT